MYTQFIIDCIKAHKRYKIYHLGDWKRKRLEVLKFYHNECYDCRKKGILILDKIDESLEVHHVKSLDEYPELFLEMFYKDLDGTLKPNLLPLCHKCHDKREGRFTKKSGGFMNEERW